MLNVALVFVKNKQKKNPKSDLLRYGSNVPKCCCKYLSGGLKPPDAPNRLRPVDFSTICAGVKHWVIALTQTHVKNLQECDKWIDDWKKWFPLHKNKKKCDLGGVQGPLVTPAILGHVCTATQSAVVLDRAEHRSGVVVNKNTTNTQLVSALVSLLCNSRDTHWRASPENTTKTCRTWTRCERLRCVPMTFKNKTWAAGLT